MTRSMMSDVVIVGAGVIGSSISLCLSRLGYKVHTIDSKRGAGAGTTSFSSGVCRMNYSMRDSIQFSWEGYQYWKEWEEYIGTQDPRGFASLRECGSVMLRTPSTEAFLKKSVMHMSDVGVPVLEWDLATAKENLGKLGWDLSQNYRPYQMDDPNFGVPVSNSEIEGAVYFPTSGYVSDPLLASENLCLAAQQAGCKFSFNVTMVDMLQEGGKVVGVVLDDGSVINAPIVLNAAGPHSNLVTKMAFPEVAEGRQGCVLNDMKFSTRPMRQEVAYVPAPPGVDLVKDGLMAADLDVGVYWRPEVGNKLLIGGVEAACDTAEWCDGNIDTNMNHSLTNVWTNYVYRAALRMPSLPIPTASETQGIVSAYDCTPDWMPIYDKSSLGGYYMAIGTSGNQFKNAGIVGTLMSTLINEVENGLNHDEKPLQLEMKKSNPGTFLNTACFSRLRNVEATGTTATVLG